MDACFTMHTIPYVFFDQYMGLLIFWYSSNSCRASISRLYMSKVGKFFAYNLKSHSKLQMSKFTDDDMSLIFYISNKQTYATVFIKIGSYNTSAVFFQITGWKLESFTCVFMSLPCLFCVLPFWKIVRPHVFRVEFLFP